jgi:hypothetical protein
MAQVIVKAPIFHGKKEAEAKLGCTAEDFIAQVDNLTASNTWSDQVAAGNAISYLNGAARFWWAESLDSIDPAGKTAATTSYAAFSTLFKEWFFSVKDTHDLSVDWTGLKQRGNEPVVDFALRVTGSLGQYRKLFPLPPRPADTPAAVETGLRAMYLAAGADHRDAVANLRPAVRTAAIDFHLAGATAGIRSVLDDITIKLISEGVRDLKQRELIRRQHKLGVALRALFPMMRDLEEASARKESNPVPTPKLMPINAEAAEMASPNQQLSAEEIDVINNLRRGGGQAAKGGNAGRGGKGGKGGRGGRGGPKGGGGNGNPQAAPPTNSTPPAATGRVDDATYYSKTCTYCSKYGHLKEVCFKRERDEKNKAAGGVSAANGNVSTLQPQQQQQGSLNTLGWM